MNDFFIWASWPTVCGNSRKLLTARVGQRSLTLLLLGRLFTKSLGQSRILDDWRYWGGPLSGRFVICAAVRLPSSGLRVALLSTISRIMPEKFGPQRCSQGTPRVEALS